MEARTGEDILYLGIRDWNTMQVRPHHLARGLSKFHRVLYINPCYYSAPGYVRDTLAGHRVRERLYGLRQVGASLFVADFPPLFPAGLSFPKLGNLNYRLLAPIFRAVLQRLGMLEPILWLSLPPDRALIGHVGEQLAIYDCMDNHSYFQRNRARRRMELEEIRLLQECDLVLASSEPLRTRCQQYNQNVHIVRNAVDLDHFSLKKTADFPPMFQEMNRPIIGYLGSLGHWVDLNLLAEVARVYGTATVVLVGPIRTDVSMLSNYDNIRVLGELPYSQVPACLNGFDVCLIPFLKNELTKAVNPIKLYEYLALGKPVVATDLPELRSYRDLCYLAATPEEFVELIGHAISDDEIANGSLARGRRRRAEENSWQHRIEDVTGIIHRSLPA